MTSPEDAEPAAHAGSSPDAVGDVPDTAGAASPAAPTPAPPASSNGDATADADTPAPAPAPAPAAAHESTSPPHAASKEPAAPAPEAEAAQPHAPAPTSAHVLDAPSTPARAIKVQESTRSPRTPLAAVNTAAASAAAHHAPDSPTTTLIASLREQLELVSEQAQQLNTKLVASISKHADLEDQIFGLQSEKHNAVAYVTELERAKAQWEESMNTGLLVERDQITAEMQRLAAGLVEEERKRGTAEERRAQVENEVDDLAASLFDQANTMVATERMSRAQAEERLKESEENLAVAEAAMRDMQQHLQSLSASDLQQTSSRPLIPRRYISSHPPYAEFLSFLQHLRAARPRSARSRDLYPAPTVNTLLAQPFLTRCVQEDHEPALRLDAAPNLGFMSRRTVGAAIISGDLLIEPVAASALGLPESVSCALCGRNVFGHGGASTAHPSRGFGLGKISLFSSPTTGSHNAGASHTSVYVFRTATERDKAYPLCRNGWCLERLRAACALWHFVRTGIIVPVWNSEDVQQHSREPSGVSTASGYTASTVVAPTSDVPAPVHNVAAPPPPPPVRSPSVTSPTASASASASSPPPTQPQPRKGWMGGWGSWSRPTTPPEKKEAAAVLAVDEEGTSAAAAGATAPTEPESPRDAKHQPATPSPLGQQSPVEVEAAEPIDAAKTEADKAATEVETDKAETDKAETEDQTEKDEVAPEDSQKKTTETSEKEAANGVKDAQTASTTEAQAATAEPPAATAEPPAATPEQPAATTSLERVDSRASHSGGSETSFATPGATPVLENSEFPSAADGGADAADEAKADVDVAVDSSAGKPDDKDPEEAVAKPVATTTDAEATVDTPAGKPEDKDTEEADTTPVATTTDAEATADTPAGKPEDKDTEEEADAKPVATAAEADAQNGDKSPASETAAAPAQSPSPRPPARAAARGAPPPLPKRAAGRGLQPGGSAAPSPPTTPTQASSGHADSVGVSPVLASPLRAAVVAEPDREAELEPETAAVAAPDAAVVEEKVEADGTATPTVAAASPTPAGRAPPPLPPRHPGVANAPSNPGTPASAARAQGGEAVADKTFATGDAWEVRAWRQVVRLKEDMWRARVGVVDDE